MTAVASEAAIPYLDIDDEELTDDQLREKYAPICIGPTWKKNPDGSWHLPERTLGWQVVAWVTRYIRDPNDPEGKKPFIFTPEQLRFTLWWYAVDEQGEFRYRAGNLVRVKGWGKDPLAAVYCLVEWLGPARVLRDSFGAPVWDEDGDPLGTSVPSSWVQIAAVSQSQTENTTSLFPSLISEEMKADYDIIPGSELYYANGRTCRLQAVTSSYRALEGGRASMVLLNETHHFVHGNHGDKMFEVVTDNATKMNARYLSITNAYLPGEDSVAEKIRESWEKEVELFGEDASDLLMDSLEAPPHVQMTGRVLRVVIEMVRGDAKWLNPDAIISKIRSGAQSLSRSKRMWLNSTVADDDGLYQPDQWKVLERNTTLLPDEKIVLGMDGGRTEDSTAIVAIRVSDHVAFKLGLWEKPDGPAGDDWEVPHEQVVEAVHAAFRTYNVVGFYADVAYWESFIHEWSRLYGDRLAVQSSPSNPIAWDMRSQKRATLAHEQLVRAIFDGTIGHNGDLQLRRHVLNARRSENNFGVSFRKESRSSPKKVDAYAALMLAYTCLRDFETKGKEEAPRTGRAWFF